MSRIACSFQLIRDERLRSRVDPAKTDVFVSCCQHSSDVSTRVLMSDADAHISSNVLARVLIYVSCVECLRSRPHLQCKC